MYDKELVIDIMDNVLLSINKIIIRTQDINSSDDFLKDENNLIILDSVCMQLIAIGQAIKDIDRITNKQLLVNYSHIPWRNIAGVRDILSHNYFNLNAETVFGILDRDIIELRDTIERIIGDLK